MASIFVNGPTKVDEKNTFGYQITALNLPQNATMDAAREIFSIAGNILKMHISPKTGRSNSTKNATITYDSEDAALRAFSICKYFNGQRLYFRNLTIVIVELSPMVAEDTHALTELEFGNASSYVYNVDATTINVLYILSDYMLEDIMKSMLLQDQLRFALTCKRFFMIYIRNFGRIFGKLAINNFKTRNLKFLEDFFIVLGPCVEEIIGATKFKNRARIISFIAKFCPNVKTIDLSRCPIDTKDLRTLVMDKPKLKTMNLRSCGLRCIAALIKLPSLRNLKVSDNIHCGFTRNLPALINLQALQIKTCKVGRITFRKICMKLKKLRILDIRCIKMETSDIQLMVAKLKNLETLKITIYSHVNLQYIVELPKLNDLTLDFTMASDKALLFEISNKLLNKLEKFSLTRLWQAEINITDIRQISKMVNLKQLKLEGCTNFSDSMLLIISKNLINLEVLSLPFVRDITQHGLSCLIEKCPKLVQIHLEFAFGLTNTIILELLRILKAKKIPKRVLIEIDVSCTDVNEDILTNPEFMNNDYLILYNCSSSWNVEYDEFNIEDIEDEEDEVDSDDELEYFMDID